MPIALPGAEKDMRALRRDRGARAHEPAASPAAAELALLQQRDPAAWSALFEREHGAVFRCALAFAGEPAAAEDITAQAFLEAMEGIARYRDRGRPLRAWLFAIARHRAIDWLRARRRDPGGAPEQATPGPGEQAGEAIAALSLLTLEQREVVYLRFIEGYSTDEAARLTGRSPGAVKALQHRALQRLRRILQPAGGTR